jgi:hypothetical protein
MKRIGLLSLTVMAVVGLLAIVPLSPAAAWEPKGQDDCIAPANPVGIDHDSNTESSKMERKVFT